MAFTVGALNGDHLVVIGIHGQEVFHVVHAFLEKPVAVTRTLEIQVVEKECVAEVPFQAASADVGQHAEGVCREGVIVFANFVLGCRTSKPGIVVDVV